MARKTIRRRALLWLAVLTGVALTGCTAQAGSPGSNAAASEKVSGVTIGVTTGGLNPPPAALKEFTRKTGINVRWINLSYDDMQTKITASATAHTYFADVVGVGWDRVRGFHELGWFTPLNKYMDVDALKTDIPQITSFVVSGDLVAFPIDGSFMVTTVNKDLFKRAGITTMPTTLDEYTSALRTLKSSGVAAYPLGVPFAAAEGLSTYWYELTAAFGGSVLGSDFKPEFTAQDSAGHRAMQWLVDAYKTGLVAPASINMTDGQVFQSQMAQGQIATVFSDYVGQVATLYNVPSASKVVGQIEYAATPGANGPGPNLNNQDAIGIPATAKYPKAAAEFIKWFTTSENEANWAGLSGDAGAVPYYPIPSRLSSIKKLSDAGKMTQGDLLLPMLQASRPVFSAGPPSWYAEFSRTVYTNIHAAASGQQTVDAAIDAIAQTAERLRTK